MAVRTKCGRTAAFARIWRSAAGRSSCTTLFPSASERRESGHSHFFRSRAASWRSSRDRSTRSSVHCASFIYKNERGSLQERTLTREQQPSTFFSDGRPSGAVFLFRRRRARVSARLFPLSSLVLHPRSLNTQLDPRARRGSPTLAVSPPGGTCVHLPFARPQGRRARAAVYF